MLEYFILNQEHNNTIFISAATTFLSKHELQPLIFDFGALPIGATSPNIFNSVEHSFEEHKETNCMSLAIIFKKLLS